MILVIQFMSVIYFNHGIDCHHNNRIWPNENDSDPFQFSENDEERWELQNSSSDERSTESMNDISDDTSIRKIPFSKDVSVNNGGYSFQIELMDVLQRHKTDLKNAQ